MSEINNIVDQLNRAWDGDAWHGPPVQQVLKDITAAQAIQRPIAGAHSIWELVLHMTGWKREVAARMRGKPAGEPQRGDWPEVTGTSDAAWRAALADLAAAHRELVEAARSVRDDQLHAAVKDPRNRELGSGATHYVTLHGIVQHDLYHAGQIAILRKAFTDAGS